MPRSLAALLKLVDIFAGCGGMTSGFVDVGGTSSAVFDPVFAIEADAHAAETYRANFGSHVVCRPIQEVRDEEFPEADLVIGGPPCQGFSTLNRQREGDLRRLLW